MSTPVQRQYQSLKAEHPEAVLFFQLGDFYELFYEDAHVGSRVLGLQLTARHRGTDNEMAMCGFPMRASAEYMKGLLEAGYKVAVADQKTDENGTIYREVTRVITPGTRMNEEELGDEVSSYLLAFVQAKHEWALAYIDISTGDFRTTCVGSWIELLTEIHRLGPQEILVPLTLYEDTALCEQLPKAAHLSPVPVIAAKKAPEVLVEQFGVKDMQVLGLRQLSLSVLASAYILQYLSKTQKSSLPHIPPPRVYHPDETMHLDTETLRHLEVFVPMMAGEKDSTLISVLKKPSTAMGRRTIKNWLLRPLLSRELIGARQRVVGHLMGESGAREHAENLLGHCHDLERLTARLSATTGNAKQLAMLRDCLGLLPNLGVWADECGVESATLEEMKGLVREFGTLHEELQEALVEVPPVELMAGGIIAEGYDRELDELRQTCAQADTWLEGYLKTVQEETGIPRVKAQYNKTFGWYLEVRHAHTSLVPEDWTRRQTLVNAERYITPELKEYETKILTAQEKAYAREYALYTVLRQQMLPYTPKLLRLARVIGRVDAMVSLAATAAERRWVMPQFVEEGAPQTLRITKGRHPVVEALSSEPFIANSVKMEAETSTVHLITGPNMAGKSTYLRQNALCVLLAHVGSGVPAESMETSVFDRIYTRVGAGDSVATGKSTFYVEMAETARILRHATPKSFVILDEIGRGTSTFDGLSLAWAITEYIHNTLKAFTIFATHYHELVDLADELERAENYHSAVHQDEGGVVFLRRIRKGGMNDSFGIEVAHMAGIPPVVVEKAREVLGRLESESLLSGKPTLWSTYERPTKAETRNKEAEKVAEKIASLDLDEMTPMEAMMWLVEQKKDQKRGT